MPFGVSFYGGLVVAYGCACLIFQTPPSRWFLGTLFGTVSIYTLQLFGFAPRWLSSALARAIHAPEDVYFRLRNVQPFHYTSVHDFVLVGRKPRSELDIQNLIQDENIKAVVSLNEPWELNVPMSTWAAHGVATLSLPTPDYAAPTADDVDKAVGFITDHVKRHEHVYVHCHGGKGRSVVVAVAALMVLHGWSKEQAFAHVRSRRHVANMRRLRGIMPQWRALRAFEKSRELTK
eukprot:m.16422 g.16422  ORF g.16422 m.16422 type:complete len:234 (+) comp3137_c0_seq1:55-756(+)